MGYYVHHTPGRLRVKIPQIKHRPYKAKYIKKLFEHFEDVYSIEVNTTTGSVKIHYDPDQINPDQFLNLLKYNQLFDETRVIDQMSHMNQAGHNAGKVIGKAAFSWTLGRLLDANGLSLLTALI